MSRRNGFALLPLLLALWAPTLADASPFTDWQSGFDKGEQPKREAMLGLWAGKCADRRTPTKPVAAIYAYREMGENYDSQSHFLGSKHPADYYEKWTLAQAQHDAELTAWQNAENWPSVFVDEKSVENLYDEGNRTRLRAVRSHGDTLYLEVRRADGSADPSLTCAFTHHLADAPVVPTNFLCDSGVTDGGMIDQDSHDTQTAYRSIEVQNYGDEPVSLSVVRVQTAAGWLAVPGTIKLESESSTTFSFSDKPEAVLHLQAFLTGKTKNVRFLGIK